MATSDYGDVAAALAAAEAAIAVLKQAAAGTSAVSALAQSSLAQIEQDAKLTRPPAPNPVGASEKRGAVAGTPFTSARSKTGKKPR
jgi:hypothetical protein